MADNPLVATNDTCTCEALQCSAIDDNTTVTREPALLKFLTHTRGRSPNTCDFPDDFFRFFFGTAAEMRIHSLS
jgi:hypothetical protein